MTTKCTDDQYIFLSSTSVFAGPQFLLAMIFKLSATRFLFLKNHELITVREEKPDTDLRFTSAF